MENSWIKTYENKLKLYQLLELLYFLVPFLLSFLFGFLGGEMTTYIAEDGEVIVDAAAPELVIIAIILSIVAFVNFIKVFIALIHTRSDKATYKGHVIMALVMNKRCILVIDGEEAERVRRLNYKDFVVLNGTTSSGIDVTCKVSGIETHFTYKDPHYEDKRSTVVVNNYKKSKSKKNNDDLTPIQKKLIQNAKTDALASIDAGNVEDAKKKIDLYNKLDELDD